jgi:putative restriction endonuclease
MTPTLSAQGFVANTDHDWFRYLRAKGPLDEVNFWQPSGSSQFRAVPPGAPFFFRLKSPFNAIGGFGFFSRFNLAPAWLAWDSFGDLNGAASLDEMVVRINRYRRPTRPEDGGRSDGFIVGCIMIGSPVFFADDDWVREPVDWQQNIVRGKRIDLLHGEGQRILSECLERSRSAEPQSEIVAVALDAARRGEPILVAPRLGQGTFRIALVSAYDGACAVTREHSLPVLEAAHIRPFAEGGPHDLSNGLLLRADVHRLYDKGYVTVTGDYDFRVSERLVDDFHNGREYLRFGGARIAVPRSATERPSQELLEWHAHEVFRG